MEKIHLLICGERGVGKSTLIQRLVSELPVPVCGFITKREPTPDENGFFPIYIHYAAETQNARNFSRDNLIGICDSKKSIKHSEAFDNFGVQILSNLNGGIVVMDELGFLENDSPAFQKAVLNALNGDIPVIAAVKPKDTPFLKAVRLHEKAELVMIDQSNRDELYEKLLPRLQEICLRYENR